MITILLSIYDSNNKIQTTYLVSKNSNVNGVIKIIHISDLHEKCFGKENQILIKKIRDEHPDLVFITGDVASFSDENMKILEEKSIERYNNNLDYTIDVLKKIRSVAPIYFVLGNHEHVFEKFDGGFNQFKQIVNNTGTTLLINDIETIKINETVINILGVDNSYYQDVLINQLVKKIEKMKGLKIILDHYPTDFALNGKFSYINYDIDYVFSGHEHGGQIRLPILGGVFSHEEGLFPKYSEGVHVKNGVTLIISRGLGNSTFPIRIFNNPELIVMTINGES